MSTCADKRTALVGLAVLGLVVLTACGGGGSATDTLGKASSETRVVSGAMKGTAASPSIGTVAMQQEGARLNAAELATIAKTGVLPEAFEGLLLSGAEGATAATQNAAASPRSLGEQKSAASRVPVYRFFNTRTSAHFFTVSEVERSELQATQPHMTYEGPAFFASHSSVPGLSPVYRFFNATTGVHFYTISLAERNHISANLSQFSYEGVAYYASTLPGLGYTPLFRFFYAARGFHFYTASEAEAASIRETLPQYTDEGVAYYTLGGEWETPAVPHTGISTAQCYQGASHALVACADVGATALNPQQDGHRTGLNPMRYGLVGSNPRTSCVRDNVTGLIWEGKEATGTRAGATTYTNYGSNAPGDASDYVNAVNAMNLCGFNDWRLPAVDELQGLVNYGYSTGSRISQTYFPNTYVGGYWTHTWVAADPNEKWSVGFDGSSFSADSTALVNAVRLVRGAQTFGQRHVITTVVYLGDAINNAVLDRKTGLTWRRCLEGQVWGGASCSGTINRFTHSVALSHLRSGWRMPNIKELGSLSNFSRYAAKLDPVTFPGSSDLYTWAATPYADDTREAWLVNFYVGRVYHAARSLNDAGLRLVHTLP